MAITATKRTPRKQTAVAKTPIQIVQIKPRILYLVHNHPRLAPGGSEIFAHRAFTHLRDIEKREIFFLAACGRQHQPKHGAGAFMTLGDRNSALADEWLFFADAFDYFLQSSRQEEVLANDFARLLTDLKPDIVHVHHTLRLGLEILPLIKSVLPDAKIVYTLHDFVPICLRDGQMVRNNPQNELCNEASAARCHQCFPEIAPQRFLLREQFIKQHLAYVDRFISPSEFLAQRYIEWGIAPERIKVIPNGFAGQTSLQKRESLKRNRFAYFGQITPYKGVLELIEAARLLAKQSADLRIDIHGGMSQQTQEFQDKVTAALKTAPSFVHYHGAYQADQLNELMDATDWVIVPSIWWENAPLVIDEAFAHGRPILCSGIGGMREKVRDGFNGLHMRPAQPQHMAEVIAQAASDTKLWSKLAHNITTPVSMTESMRQHVELYDELK